MRAQRPALEVVVVWAEAGKIFAGRIGPAGLVDTRVLHDLDPLRFERLQAPY